MQFRSLALTIVSAAAMSFVACGSDSSSGTSRESDSSSGTASSSSAVESSSSEVAVVSQLPKNSTLGKFAGMTLWLTKGDYGMYSLWFLDSTLTSYYASAVIYSTSAKTLSFDSTAGILHINSTAANAIYDSLVNKGITLTFSVSDSTLQVSVNGAKSVKVNTASYAITDNSILSKASNLIDKKMTASSGNSVYYFYKNGRYFREGATAWEAGHYDIHRQQLFLIPVIADTSTALQLSAYTLSSSTDGYTFAPVTGSASVKYVSSAFAIDYPDSTKLAKDWITADDSLSWRISLKNNAISVYATIKGTTKEAREINGVWKIFGDKFVFKAQSCASTKKLPCPIQYGTLSAVKDSSVKYVTPDTSVWALPANWTLPDYQ